jgi:hypothetical protein
LGLFDQAGDMTIFDFRHTKAPRGWDSFYPRHPIAFSSEMNEKSSQAGYQKRP